MVVMTAGVHLLLADPAANLRLNTRNARIPEAPHMKWGTQLNEIFVYLDRSAGHAELLEC